MNVHIVLHKKKSLVTFKKTRDFCSFVWKVWQIKYKQLYLIPSKNAKSPHSGLLIVIIES